MCRWPFFVVKIDNAKCNNYLLVPIPSSTPCKYKPFDGALGPSQHRGSDLEAQA